MNWRGRSVLPLLIAVLLLPALACSSPSKRIEELSTSPEPDPGISADAIHIRDSGFVWDGETLSYAFTAENTTADKSMEEAVVQVNVFGMADQPIASDSGIIDFLLPGQVVAFASHLTLKEEPKRLAFDFAVADQTTVEETRAFEVTPGKFEPTNYGGRVVAAIANPYQRELRRLNVVAVLRDQDGKILNGGSGILELLPSQGESTVTIDILGVPPAEPAGVDVYTMFSAETVFRLE